MTTGRQPVHPQVRQVPHQHKHRRRRVARLELELAGERTHELLPERPRGRLPILGQLIRPREEASQHPTLRHFSATEVCVLDFGLWTLDFEPNQSQSHRAEICLLPQRPDRQTRLIAEHNVVHPDIPPGPRRVVHNLKPAGLSCPLAHIPTQRAHGVLVKTRRRQHHLVIHSEVHAGLVFVRAAADQKRDVIPLYTEGSADQLTGRRILFLNRAARGARMAIGHPLPFSSNVTLVSGDLRNLRRPGAEGGAAYSPVAISLALEILEEDVPPLRRRVGRHLFSAAFQEQEFVVAHQAIAPHAILRLGGVQANRVLQPARQFSFDLRGAVVLDRELHDCSGQRRIIRVERDEW